jgi:predicted nuclease of predicted toxin-antitoxin system
VRFLVDEDVPIEAARCVRQAGHEVLLVAETLGTGTDDADVWYHAVQTQDIVITRNRQDYLQLAGTEPATGLIVLKRRRTRQAKCNHLLRLLMSAGENGLKNNINFACERVFRKFLEVLGMKWIWPIPVGCRWGLDQLEFTNG